MGEALSAFRNEPFDLRRRDAVRGEPSWIHAEHERQITACGMAAYKDFLRIAAIILNVFHHPCEACGGILQAVDDFAAVLLGEAVAHAADDDRLFFVAFEEGSGYAFRAACETAAMIPDDDGAVLRVFRSVDVENASFLYIIVDVFFFRPVADVFRDDAISGGLRENTAGQTKKNNG